MKITVHKNDDMMTLKPEGTLAGEWVGELRFCWQQNVTAIEPRLVRVDLREVTYVDDAGKELLALMCRHGVELMTADVLMEAVVQEIVREGILIKGVKRV